MTVFQTMLLVLPSLYLGIIVLVLWSLKKKPQKGKPPRGQVSVVVAARNEEDSIGELLQDLCEQSFPTDRYEVVVADDSSSDKTATIIQDYADRYPFIHSVQVPPTPPGTSPKKFALSQAILRSSGDFIVATDADCRVGPHWIETLMSFFKPDIGFVIGFSQFGRRGEKQNRIERLQAFDFVQLMGVAAASSHLGLPLAASGQNMAYRRLAFDQVGGFRRIAHRVSGDDVLLLQLVRKYTGWKSVFAHDAKAFVSSRPQPSLKALINQRKRWASNSSAQLSLNRPFFAYLLLTWLVNAALFLAPIALMFKGNGWAIWAGALAAKGLGEGVLALKTTALFQRRDLLPVFPLWFFAQIPYIVFVGLTGSFGRFQWKDRSHRSVA
ncbi:glycosyltransferase [candidate division KSB1 bacterium]|nr:glycosyltransferase [candidate division KSB1 bacterium]